MSLSNDNNYGGWNVSGNDIMLDKATDNSINIGVDFRTNYNSPSKTENKSRKKYCKYCGFLIDSESRKCTGCGKQYFRIFHLKISHIIIFSLLIIAIESLFFNINQKNSIKALKEEIKSVESELDFWKGKAGKPNYTISYEVSEIIVSAQSAAGVGDVFYFPISDLSYRMYDNNIGDTYKVNYKINGDSNNYDYNEDWYCVTLSNGKTGFIWGGRNNMYVREIVK